MSATVFQLLAALFFALALPGTARGAKVAIVDLAGTDFGHNNGVDVNSSPTTLDAQTRYYYRIEGTVVGTGPLAFVIPSGTNIADLLEDIEPGSSAQLVGFYDNPSGTLPFTYINRTYNGQVSTPAGNVTASLNLLGSVNASGIVRFQVTDVSLTLGGNPVAGTIVFENGSKATIGIPPKLQFSAATASVVENGGSIVLTVQRTENASGSHAVNFATANGTAQAGTHYTAASGTLNFGNGVTSRNITVNITNNAAQNADRTFTVTLSAPTLGAELGTPATVTVTINDDDAASPFINAGFTGLGGGMAYGFIHFNTTSTGQITGALLSDGLNYPFKGKLDANGVFNRTLRPKAAGLRGASGLTLNLTVAPDNNSFTGTFASAPLAGERDKVGTMAAPVAEAGTFTALLGVSSIPTGGGPLSGFLTLKVGATGTAKFKGALPDGAKLKGASHISITGKLPVAFGLYKNKSGFLTGTTAFAQTDLLRWTGALAWTKQPGSSGLYGTVGLANVATALAGVPYAKPAGGTFVLSDLNAENGQATVSLDQGNLATPLNISVTVDTKNKVRVDNPGPEQLQFKLIPKKGLFRGSFQDGNILRKCQGALLQDSPGTQVGGGFFLGTDVAGRVIFNPKD